ncbi:hypothetical protein PZH32_12760, partial [Adlercreutzia equolifaciens]|uniref:hypothetical protein n=1 Tax=Adlercreutzia equolifaciens TaxID=446660 RepID=UPI0023AEE9E3
MLTIAYSEDGLDTDGLFVNRGVVRGFKTSRLDFGTALDTIGTLTSIDLEFLQPDGHRFTKTLNRSDLTVEADGSLVLDFEALWGTTAVNDAAFGAKFASDN